jgi:trigger factor
MQVSVEEVDSLQRRLTVQVPADQIELEIENRLKSLAKTARIDGFRPGKVPFKVVQGKFEGRVREQVLDELMKATFQDAVREQNLRPVGEPKFHPLPQIRGQDLTYTAEIEVFPQIQLAPLEGIKVGRPVTEVTQGDVDNMIEILRKQRITWNSADRAAAMDDQVTIDLEVQVVGSDQPAYRQQQLSVVIGAGSLPGDLETRIVGMTAGHSGEFDIAMGADVQPASLAGQQLRAFVQVHQVMAPLLPDLDEDFVRSFGVTSGDMTALRGEIRSNMERELQLAIKANVKTQVLSQLMELNPIKVPESLVDEEFTRLMARQESVGAPTREDAYRRVALGMIVAGIVQGNAIQVDPLRVRAMVETIAQSYEQPEEVIKWYYSNRDMISGVEGAVLEEQVVEWVMERVEVTEKLTTFDALMQPKATPNHVTS